MIIIFFSNRSNLVSNIFKQYKSTGYVWEHYHDKTGAGKVCIMEVCNNVYAFIIYYISKWCLVTVSWLPKHILATPGNWSGISKGGFVTLIWGQVEIFGGAITHMISNKTTFSINISIVYCLKKNLLIFDLHKTPSKSTPISWLV